jgi:hypothetical protein
MRFDEALDILVTHCAEVSPSLAASENNYVTTLPPLFAVGRFEVADEITVSMEAAVNKIRLSSQGSEDLRIIGDRQVAIVVAHKGQLHLLNTLAAPSRITKSTVRRAAGVKTSLRRGIPAFLKSVSRTQQYRL